MREFEPCLQIRDIGLVLGSQTPMATRSTALGRCVDTGASSKAERQNTLNAPVPQGGAVVSGGPGAAEQPAVVHHKALGDGEWGGGAPGGSLSGRAPFVPRPRTACSVWQCASTELGSWCR